MRGSAFAFPLPVNPNYERNAGTGCKRELLELPRKIAQINSGFKLLKT